MPSLVPLLASLVSVIGSASAATSSSPLPSRGLVIVLRPANVDELTRTALARVTGELAAARFQVTIVPLDPTMDPTRQVETVAPESNAVAALAIAHVSDSNDDTIAIWVCDRLGRRTTIERMTMRGKDVSQEAEVLALEAIELIRVSIAGLWPPPPRSPSPDPDATRTAARSLRPEISIAVGVAMLQDIDGPSPQWMASLTGMARWPRGFAVRAQLMGLGPALVISSTDGNAAVHREIVSLGPAWVFRLGEKVHSFVSMAMGAEHVAAVGATLNPAFVTEAHSKWLALASVGVGAAARLGAHISVFASVDGLWTWPRLDLKIGDTRTAPFSRPGALVNVGLQARF
jgi:hypothetical protein